jgi:hypothetical protein
MVGEWSLVGWPALRLKDACAYWGGGYWGTKRTRNRLAHRLIEACADAQRAGNVVRFLAEPKAEGAGEQQDERHARAREAGTLPGEHHGAVSSQVASWPRRHRTSRWGIKRNSSCITDARKWLKSKNYESSINSRMQISGACSSLYRHAWCYGMLASALPTLECKGSAVRKKGADIMATRRVSSGRRIVNQQPSPSDGYLTRLVKYVPVEFVTIFLTINNFLVANPNRFKLSSTQYAIVAAVLLVVNAIYIWRATSEKGQPPATTQIIISTILYAIFMGSISGPFQTAIVPWFTPQSAAIVLPVALFIAGFIDPNPQPVSIQTQR